MLSDKFDIIIPPQDIACAPGLQKRLASGDTEAFGWLYQHYCKKVFDYAMLITGNDAVSEDAVHDVFFKLWLNREKLNQVTDFNGYFYMLYRNHLVSVLRKEKMELTLHRTYCLSRGQNANPADAALLFKDSQGIIQKCVEELPQQQKNVFVLRKDYGFKREQVAKAMGIAVETEKKHMIKAMKKLRHCLAEIVDV